MLNIFSISFGIGFIVLVIFTPLVKNCKIIKKINQHKNRDDFSVQPIRQLSIHIFEIISLSVIPTMTLLISSLIYFVLIEEELGVMIFGLGVAGTLFCLISFIQIIFLEHTKTIIIKNR